MELEFDKEIDALLRKSRGNDPPTGGAHLDADEIAAFVENVLPAQSRQAFTAHLAECSRCRRILATAAISVDLPVESPVAQPLAEIPRAPWYSALFKFPALSYALGGMVVLFAGALVFVFLRSGQVGEISQTFEKASTANSVVNPVANTAAVSNTMSNSTSNASSAPTNTANSAPATSGPPTVGGPGPRPVTDDVFKDSPNDSKVVESDDGYGNTNVNSARRDQEMKQSSDAPGTVGQVAPAATPGKPVTDAEPAKREQETAEVQENADEERLSKPRSPSKKKVADSRSVGGKSFKKVGGVWFDAAYGSQPQTSVKRGSDDYKALDAGLRSIAESLGGTVVVLWNGKAYRIF